MIRRIVLPTFGVIALANGCHTDPATPGTDTFTVSGKVTICHTCQPIHGVVLRLESPDTTFTTITDSAGEYVLKAIPPGEYALSAAREDDAEDDAAITNSDALIVWEEDRDPFDTILGPCELAAADVDRDGVITGTDGRAIERFLAGLRHPLEIASVRTWVFSNPVSSVVGDTEVNFTGVLLGDADGSWPSAEPTHTCP